MQLPKEKFKSCNKRENKIKQDKNWEQKRFNRVHEIDGKS